MARSRMVALGFLVLAAVPAAAESGADRAACTPDVWRLCASEIPDVGAIKSCLRREKAKLGTACRTVMERLDGGIRTAGTTRSLVASRQ